MTKLISVVLPTYNEAENIILLIKEIDRVVKYKKEFWVVDDNSPDGSANKVLNYQKKSNKKYINVLRRLKNHGLTNSLKDGIKKAKGDVVVWMDCDFSHPPGVINKLLKKINEGYDIAVASRFIKGGGFVVPEGGSNDSWAAIILSRLMNYTIQFLLGRKFGDYTSGFIAVKSRVFKKVVLRGDYGEYFIDLIYKAYANNFIITEIPYYQLPRRAGQSKTGSSLWQLIKRGSKYLQLTLQLLAEKHIFHKIPWKSEN